MRGERGSVAKRDLTVSRVLGTDGWFVNDCIHVSLVGNVRECLQTVFFKDAGTTKASVICFSSDLRWPLLPGRKDFLPVEPKSGSLLPLSPRTNPGSPKRGYTR